MNYEVKSNKETPAIILHSGGTTGTPKSILLSNGNFNALAEQVNTIFKKIKPAFFYFKQLLRNNAISLKTFCIIIIRKIKTIILDDWNIR